MSELNLKGSPGDVGVIVARFQTPYLTQGHRDLIDTVRVRHPKFMIVLGIAKHIPSRQNPLDFATRAAMIQEIYPGTMVLPMVDQRDDKLWSHTLDALVRSIMPTEKIVLYGCRDSFINHYHGNFKTTEMESKVSLSATEARQQAFQDVRATEDFRRGAMYATANQWPRIIPTVDIAIYREGLVLLGKRNSEDKWRFIGGFAEKDESYESTAVRESREEAGINAPGMSRVEYIGSTPIDDWRYRGTTEQIKTSFFLIRYPVGPVKPGDDIDDVRFFMLSKALMQSVGNGERQLSKDMIVPEHHVLFDMLLHHLGVEDDRQ